ncbi:hypothetical protein [Undibacterium squillarum]|uniref:Uncharacterized protein n=1 Tax=Undibacterium squillarum TaxID=1131567 RepID=A0ABQ2Y220_9BURK|nr:hypothetical protein [Undibacterium squillarum]GGX53130.1 hypothetical protein GCM10010946_34650 [Undibacterium squillarum]
MCRYENQPAQKQLNELLKKNDYLQSCFNSQRIAFAEALAAIVKAVVAVNPELAAPLAASINEIGEGFTDSGPSVRGDRSLFARAMRDSLQRATGGNG